ncbi:MAG: hypothetical protein HC831_27345 [Chloroflexia bacterium]|nr:hypothetical protein [Chloroflexia bacterium]
MRRKYLVNALSRSNILPNESLKGLDKLSLWGLRSNAAKQKILLEELGRVFLHLNQKRGYKSSRSDANLDKKDTEYVQLVKSRHQKILELGLTIGQYFYQQLKEDDTYRIKEQIFPREAYIDEFDAIITEQKSITLMS